MNKKAIAAQNKKLLKNVKEDRRIMKAMDAFSPSSMYMNDYEVRDTLYESGIMDTYSSMSSYDEWN